jgi:hypothetical protein
VVIRRIEEITYSSADQVDGLVDTAERGHIDGLTSGSSSVTNTSGVLTRTTFDNGVNEYLQGVIASKQVDDLKGVLNNANGHKLLSVVASRHHQGVGQTLNNGALSLAETLNVVSSSSVGKVLLVLGLVLKGNIILNMNKPQLCDSYPQSGIVDLYGFIVPFTEQLHVSAVGHANCSGGGQGCEARWKKYCKK